LRVSFACESLKVTTRIMHIVAWLLTQRAIESGEIGYRDGRRPERRLGHAQESDPSVVASFPRRGIWCGRKRGPLCPGQAARRGQASTSPRQARRER
jgi:hypothetical protein